MWVKLTVEIDAQNLQIYKTYICLKCKIISFKHLEWKAFHKFYALQIQHQMQLILIVTIF